MRMPSFSAQAALPQTRRTYRVSQMGLAAGAMHPDFLTLLSDPTTLLSRLDPLALTPYHPAPGIGDPQECVRVCVPYCTELGITSDCEGACVDYCARYGHVSSRPIIVNSKQMDACYEGCLQDCYVDVSLLVTPGSRGPYLQACRQRCREECYDPGHIAGIGSSDCFIDPYTGFECCERGSSLYAWPDRCRCSLVCRQSPAWTAVRLASRQALLSSSKVSIGDGRCMTSATVIAIAQQPAWEISFVVSRV
jgi:hypothetical protein